MIEHNLAVGASQLMMPGRLNEIVEQQIRNEEAVGQACDFNFESKEAFDHLDSNHFYSEIEFKV